MSSANQVTGFFFNHVNVVMDYLSLSEQNQRLAEENARFRNNMKSSFKSNIINYNEVKDSIYQQKYFYIPAKVINNSVSSAHNYITLNKGSRHGIKTEMAVVSTGNVVGQVVRVSENYSLVVSMLNTNVGLSAKIKNLKYFGSVVWDGVDFQKVKLNEISNHVPLNVGDSVITSGYGAVFPEGMLIGTIADYKATPGDSFYSITLNLAADFKSISNVNVIGNFLRKEQIELENTKD